MSSKDPEHLSSLHDNPFMKGFGRGLNLNPNPRRNDPVVTSSCRSGNGNNITDSDEPEEYHVNSGFVNKLRSKFARLENDQKTVTLTKKSASVENLISIGSSKSSNDVTRYRNRFGSAGRSSNDDSTLSTESKAELRKKVPTESRQLLIGRPSSSEMTFAERPPLPKSTDHSRSNIDRKRTRPPLPARKASSDSLLKRNSASDIIPKTEHHDWKVAPDLEIIGRDNIVIIESSAPTTVEQKTDKEDVSSGFTQEPDDSYRHARPIKDMTKDENELPKPNTVSAFRSLFENVNTASEVVQTWRHLSHPRKSSIPEKGSSQILSPVSSPRTPLSRKNDDNVFEDSGVTVQEKLIKSSPHNSSTDNVPEVDTTPVSLRKSMEIFQREAEAKPSEVISSQSTLTPQHPLSNVFDSSAIKADTQKWRKPKLHVDTNAHIPRDTLQMKHEGILKTYHGDMSPTEQTVKSPEVVKSPQKSPGFDYSPKEKPSTTVSRSSGKTSPRKTKIFDSSQMVKKERPPPKVPTSPAEAVQTQSPFESMKKVEIEIKDAEKEVVMDTSPPIIPEPKMPDQTRVTSGMTEIKPVVIPPRRNKGDKRKDNDLKATTNSFGREPNFPKPLTFETKVEPNKKSPSEEAISSNGEAPVSGMSSFLANRLNKSKTEQENQPKTVHLANGSSPSPVPRKRQAPERPVVNGDVEMAEEKPAAPPLPITPEPSLPKTNIDDLFGKKKSKKNQPATKMVFDSSNIASKRKEPPKRKPPRQTLAQMNEGLQRESAITPVPKLDLTSITDTNTTTEYQEGYIPTVIKPCTFKFIGAEVTFEKTPYKKTRSSKAKIQFADNAITTFEYDDEESALAQYLREHPEEEEEVRRQQEEIERSENEHSPEDLLTDSPRKPEPDSSAMKSNTIIGIQGLSSYNPKIAVPDFQFGMTPEPDDYYLRQPEPEVEESRDLLPADESELDTFSSEVTKPDMLF